LDFNSLGANGVVSLVDALKMNETLTYLNLNDNNIGGEGVIALTEMLKMNKSLIELRYSRFIAFEFNSQFVSE
jgi:hypothetical protein